jgi:hypothetical protein
MTDLKQDFRLNNMVNIDLHVPFIAVAAMQKMAEIIKPKTICIAGGFARGLYMQQILGLSPQMSDIDVFADFPAEMFGSVERRLKEEFGEAIRFHMGRFEKEENSRGLIEFSLPQCIREKCAFVESIQLNFGEKHSWANAYDYINLANVGMNQIAITQEGGIVASNLFINDMSHKTMTMNAQRDWTVNDWDRTSKLLARMQKERPEFSGWKIKRTQRPFVPEAGAFWRTQGENIFEPSI